jgi:hypothetical protein
MNERELGRIEIGAEGFTAQDAADMIGGMDRRKSSALALYRLMRANGQLSKSRILEYRCRARGCQLLDVFETPAGAAAYKPAFRLSPGRNESSSPEARATRTSDGDRRWEETADLLMPSPLEYWVTCDHVLNYPLPAARVAADSAARRGQIMLLPDDVQ